ncbi:MAG TPA: hypothetical protein HA230_03655 [Candidatus Aenigmarchaeota archaeon]|nr:hypothetical protein [Candidatus Aenigmarchaeota archaeon]
MVDILSFVPMTLGGIIATLVNVLIIFLALVIADKVIAHNVNVKRLLIMALIAFFLAPIIGSLIAGYVAIPYIGLILPLIVWIILGELLIKEADMKTKLKVVVVAFVVYTFLSLYLTPVIISLLPF